MSKLQNEPTVEQLASGLIISSGEARKLLGAELAELDDDALTSIILDLTELSHLLLK